MTPLRIAFCALVSALSCAACEPEMTTAELDIKLKAASASVLELDPARITIDNPQSTQTRRIWRAKVGDRIFDCDADRSFALPACTAIS